MTNIIGAALIVLSQSVTTNFSTNTIGITCQQAGCTNLSRITLSSEKTPGKKCALHRMLPDMICTNCECVAPVYEEISTQGCICWHYTNDVSPTCEIKTFLIGTSNYPLYRVLSQKVIGKHQGLIFYREGTFILGVE